MYTHNSSIRNNKDGVQQYNKEGEQWLIIKSDGSKIVWKAVMWPYNFYSAGDDWRLWQWINKQSKWLRFGKEFLPHIDTQFITPELLNILMY